MRTIIGSFTAALLIGLLSACSSPQTIRGCTIQPRTQCTGIDLADQDLTGANLEGANLQGANLEGANLTNVNLSGANLSDVNLREANLEGANLSNADMSRTVIFSANFAFAKLDNTKLEPERSSSANFRNATPANLKFSVDNNDVENITCPDGQLTYSSEFVVDCGSPKGAAAAPGSTPAYTQIMSMGVEVNTFTQGPPNSGTSGYPACTPTDPVAFLNPGATVEIQKEGLPTVLATIKPEFAPRVVAAKQCFVYLTAQASEATLQSYTEARLVANGETFYTFPTDAGPPAARVAVGDLVQVEQRREFTLVPD